MSSSSNKKPSSSSSGRGLVERLRAAKKGIRVECGSPHSAHSYATQIRKMIRTTDGLGSWDVKVDRERSTVVCQRS